jgi:hypothetical protein
MNETNIERLFSDPDAVARLMKAMNRVADEAFYVLRRDAPIGQIFYNPHLDLYILHPNMLGEFLDHMKPTGLIPVEIDPSDISEGSFSFLGGADDE